MNKSERNKVFIDRDKLYSLIEGKIPEDKSDKHHS